MTRRKPPNRLTTECIKCAFGGFKFYLHVDRTTRDSKVEHFKLELSGKHGSDLQQLFVEISRLLNHELQAR